MTSNVFFNEMISMLNLQKRRLGISFATLSEKTGISEPTLKRIFSGKHTTSHMDHFLILTDTLGVDLSMRVTDPEKLRRLQAEKKAKEIMELVRGNSAL